MLDERERGYFDSELEHMRVLLLDRPPTYDNIADLCVIAARAANRIAPEGHGIEAKRTTRPYESLSQLEYAERLPVTREAR